MEDMNADIYLSSRYLRAREWSVENASKMYLDSMKWRREVDLAGTMKKHEQDQDIFEERKAVAAAGWKMCEWFLYSKGALSFLIFLDADFHSTDRYTRPIFIQDLSYLNVEELLKATTPERIINFFAVNLESAVQHKYRACTEVNREKARQDGVTDPEKLKRIIIDDNFMILNVAGLGMGTFWSVSGGIIGIDEKDTS